LWLLRWPTVHQSAAFAVAGNVSIAVACLIAGTPVAGLLACTSFAPLAGFVALFGSSRLLTLTLTNAAACTVLAAIRVAMAGDAALAAGHLLAIAIAVLAVPIAAQMLLRLLTLDAMMSHTDALTGLRNRRGFHRSALEMIASAPTHSTPSFTIVMVDLDGFKRINDSQGHAVGDRILVAVADNLHRASRMNSVVARIGGEEFLIAELTDSDEAGETAESMRMAVASTPWGVTASVGAATVTLINIEERAALQAIEHLIAAADAAMYEAKRNGGNQVRRSGIAVPRRQ
jgi:diguanylate cyclase (GGDEF)-like protein